ncbi:MAG: high light inducible protein [Synechococcaceae cyanobacterium]|nr:high light inducible protein [Synechococcaceae cyanobacterium]
MVPAESRPLDQPPECPGDAPAAAGGPEENAGGPEPVSMAELNAWRRGFTPQAELWNGRLAMLGLSVGLTVLVVAKLADSWLRS